ncbi:unnamed protein product [Trifolium pratense]|uniref:Uncharacterized protein n=1 Tax=Trifolium pratense TaxID=57577 RepID=A0ACB0KIW3_TRIPR|nr:unnamed protein product [Trifolium pratense]
MKCQFIHNRLEESSLLSPLTVKLMASSSDSFRSLNEKFNDLMSSYGCKDGVLTILEEMLEMLNREDDIINVESIIDIPLLLTNLLAALNNFEQFRVIFAPDELDFDPDSETALPHFCFIPAEGETSLQRYTKEGETHQHDPFDTFGDIQKYIWPEVFTLGTYPTGIQTFSIFTVEEFEAILCGEGQNSWSLEELREHINITDGYTAESVPIVNLLEILQGFDRQQ